MTKIPARGVQEWIKISQKPEANAKIQQRNINKYSAELKKLEKIS